MPYAHHNIKTMSKPKQTPVHILPLQRKTIKPWKGALCFISHHIKTSPKISHRLSKTIPCLAVLFRYLNGGAVGGGQVVVRVTKVTAGITIVTPLAQLRKMVRSWPGAREVSVSVYWLTTARLFSLLFCLFWRITNINFFAKGRKKKGMKRKLQQNRKNHNRPARVQIWTLDLHDFFGQSL